MHFQSAPSVSQSITIHPVLSPALSLASKQSNSNAGVSPRPSLSANKGGSGNKNVSQIVTAHYKCITKHYNPLQRYYKPLQSIRNVSQSITIHYQCNTHHYKPLTMHHRLSQFITGEPQSTTIHYKWITELVSRLSLFVFPTTTANPSQPILFPGRPCMRLHTSTSVNAGGFWASRPRLRDLGLGDDFGMSAAAAA